MIEEIRLVFKALLFDLGGTLTTRDVEDRVVEGAALRSLIKYLASRNIQISEEDLLTAYWKHYREINDLRERYMIEIPMRTWLSRFLCRLSRTAPSRVLDTVESAIVKARIESATLYTETTSVLEELESQYLLGVVTNTSSERVARGILRSLNLNKYLECIITSAEYGVRKPYPGIFFCALREMYTRAKDAVFIGDSLKHDIAGARMSGIKSCLISNEGFNHSSEFLQPDLVVKTLAELPEALESISP